MTRGLCRAKPASQWECQPMAPQSPCSRQPAIQQSRNVREGLGCTRASSRLCPGCKRGARGSEADRCCCCGQGL